MNQQSLDEYVLATCQQLERDQAALVAVLDVQHGRGYDNPYKDQPHMAWAYDDAWENAQIIRILEQT